MNKPLIDIMRNTASFFIIQIKLNDDGVWFTLPNKDAKGDITFRDIAKVELFLKSEQFAKWHPVEFRVCDVKVMRYKRLGN